MNIKKMKLMVLTLTILAMSNAIAITESEKVKNVESFIENMRSFSKTFLTVQSMYVEKISTDELFTKALKGMVNGLDPHSDYMEPIEQERLMETSKGEFGGLGIVVTEKENTIQVISPIDDTPAYKAGIQAGDKIVKIDEESALGMKLSDAVKLMRGKPGTDIVITIIRKSEKPKKIKITREIIKVESVKGFLLDDGVGYVRVASFQQQSAKKLKEKIQYIKDKNKSPLNGMILDLRSNPGGLLVSAIDISDLFLSEGKRVVYTRGRLKESISDFYTKEEDMLEGIPVVILVNGGSASASEIVSGALQDHKRAIVMGEQTFGKGSVQTVLELDKGYGLKLTTARYYTPNGRSIQAKGIVPDIILKKTEMKSKESIEDEDVFSRRESDLAGHLKMEDLDKLTTEEIVDVQKGNADKKASKEKDTIANDYYIMEAKNIIKALSILR